MIFRLAQNIASKIKQQPTQVCPLDVNPYVDWTARLFTVDRTQYVLLTNTASLYSVLTVGRGIPNEKAFIERALGAIREMLESDGLASLYQQFILPRSGDVRFSKALNRSVTGSMNDLLIGAKILLARKEGSLLDVSYQVNDTLLSAIDYAKQRDVFTNLASTMSDA